jgi:polyferredoxin
MPSARWTSRASAIWVYPKKPRGKFTRWRKWFGYVLLALLFAGPFIRIGGEPLLMINVLERRFVFFGQTFWPQDFLIFVLGFMVFIVFVALFTVAFGRLFCGWVCPQTVFMEQVFRRIEYAIEGDWKQQQALNKGPLTTGKVWKKTVKHLLFFAISFLIGNTFLAYIIGSDELLRIISDPPAEHLGGLIAMLAVQRGVLRQLRLLPGAGLHHGVPLWPLARRAAGPQEHRDRLRPCAGEARGRFRKGEARGDAGKGDCIDCHACVHVCPTGIDIRNGTQLECVNCTACIDACDHMMSSVGLPTGLIRYASEAEIADKKHFTFNLRLKSYSAVLLALVGVLAALIFMRSDVDATVLRTPGVMYQARPDGRLSNLYAIKAVNKTRGRLELRLELLNKQGEIQLVGKPLAPEGGELVQGEMFIILAKDQLDGMKTEVEVGVYGDGKLLDKVTTAFVGPIVTR